MLYREIRAASVAAGFPATDDYHGAQTEGFQRNEMTVTRGRRGSTARVFLKPAMRRPNLTVETHALVSRVRFEGRRAVGVDYVQRGAGRAAAAAREVILAGGVYGSAQLLLLSGIGPAEQLNKHGIKTLVDLPGVGKNLIEHPFMFVGWRMRPDAFRSELRIDRATAGFCAGGCSAPAYSPPTARRAIYLSAPKRAWTAPTCNSPACRARSARASCGSRSSAKSRTHSLAVGVSIYSEDA